jgi:hypothetical protein
MPVVGAALSFAAFYIVARLVARVRPEWTQRQLTRVRESNDLVKMFALSVMFALPLTASVVVAVLAAGKAGEAAADRPMVPGISRDSASRRGSSHSAAIAQTPPSGRRTGHVNIPPLGGHGSRYE